ncbi:MAG TPA: hypothetical protein VJT71_19825 [Pyrinomonadaceae bacterium]|nr:hypothetical protein [Pyrinomonadaceae bacterium]
MWRAAHLSTLMILGSLVGTQCLAQPRAKAPADEYVGPVRSVSEWDVSSGKKLVLSSCETYDRNGKQTSYSVYKEEGGILYSDEYTYDASGRLVGTQTKHSEFVYLPDKQVHLYNHQRQLVEVKGFNASGTHLGGHVYVYDAQGNMIEERSYVTVPNPVYASNDLTRHVYGASGNEIAQADYVYNGSTLQPDDHGMGYQKRVFLHDQNGRVVLTGYLKADNTLVRAESTKYDRRGNTVAMIERAPDGHLIRRTTYSYRFDARGNWIKQIRREWAAENVGSLFGPLEVSVRKITYYSQPYRRATAN